MKLLNSQSLNYVTRKRQQELKKIDGLQSSLHLLDAAPGENKHTLFFDSKKDGVSRFSVSIDAVWESHTFRVIGCAGVLERLFHGVTGWGSG